MKRKLTHGLFIALNIFVAAVLAQTSDSTKKDASGMDTKDMPMKSMDMKAMKMDKKATTTTHKGVGVVKSINTADGVITFAHEPIKSLNWPAMTMGFKVKDKATLDKIKPGDKVEFTLVQSGKDYVVTEIR
jgi:Cu(I)/Ag(I) efflux system periplasmic protein CusF